MHICEKLQIADPFEFYALPRGAQSLWRLHVANHITGRYQPKRQQTGARGATADPQVLRQIAIERGDL